MSELKRYNIDNSEFLDEVEENETGEWVRHEDVKDYIIDANFYKSEGIVLGLKLKQLEEENSRLKNFIKEAWPILQPIQTALDKLDNINLKG